MRSPRDCPSTPMPTPTATSTPTAMLEATATPTPRPTATPTPTPRPTATATPTPTATSTPTPTPTATPEPTSTPNPDNQRPRRRQRLPATPTPRPTPTPKYRFSGDFGPKSGSLTHRRDNSVEAFESRLSLDSFQAVATFTNPYARSVGSWDYGFSVRRSEDGTFHAIVINERWPLDSRIPRTVGAQRHPGSRQRLQREEKRAGIERVAPSGGRKDGMVLRQRTISSPASI